MKIKHIALVALTALALGLASVGVGAPAVAGAKPGVASGTNITGVVVAPEPAIAGGMSGGVLGSHS